MLGPGRDCTYGHIAFVVSQTAVKCAGADVVRGGIPLKPVAVRATHTHSPDSQSPEHAYATLRHPSGSRQSLNAELQQQEVTSASSQPDNDVEVSNAVAANVVL